MSAEIASLVLLLGIHIAGAAWFAWDILKEGWDGNEPDDEDEGGGSGPPPEPRPEGPRGGDGKVPPLPDALPARIRLREPKPLRERYPRPDRRRPQRPAPAPTPARAPEREPSGG